MSYEDRTIVTFGSDEPEVSSTKNAFSVDAEIPSLDTFSQVYTDLESAAKSFDNSQSRQLAPGERIPQEITQEIPQEQQPAAASNSAEPETANTVPDTVPSSSVQQPVRAETAAAENSQPAGGSTDAEPETILSASIDEYLSNDNSASADVPQFDYSIPDASQTAEAYSGNDFGSGTIPSYSGGSGGNGGNGGSGDGGSGSDNGYSQSSAGKGGKKKEPKYVTKGFLVVCMIITMLVSSVFGAVAGGVISGQTGSNGTAARDDSALSELNLSDATGSEMTVAEIVKMNEDAVVEIVVSGTTQDMWGMPQLTQGAGSGVIVKSNGYIATNYHVIDGANKVQVTLHNGDSYEAKIIGSDAENDIAVIKIDAKDLTTATIGDSSAVSVGDLAVAIGNPLGQLGGTATTGIVSALDRNLTIEGTSLTLMQTDAAINGGNSGGGLFNSKGELIGIVESKASAVGVEGLAFALPINTVSPLINDIIKNGGSNTKKAGTPAVGIVIRDVSEENAQYYGLESAGVYIAQITGQNAQKAGFQEGDRIISFNGKEVSGSSDFITMVRKCKVGDTVTIVVSRNGQQIEIKTELEELQTNN